MNAPGTPRRRLVAVVALVPATLCALRLLGVWDCSTACAGGGYYEHLAGIPTLVLGLMAYAAFAALVLGDAWRGTWRPATVAVAWLLLGVSVFFVTILLRLGLHCPHCLAVHGMVAVGAGLLGPTSLSLRARALALAFGLLAANAAFHQQPVADILDPEHLPLPAVRPQRVSEPQGTQAEVLATIEANRSLGSLSAPWRLELAIDFYCPHCADAHAGLMKALTPLAGARLRIVTRQVVRTSLPRGAELARYALAAAAIDRPTFTALVATLLGTRPNTGWAGVRSFVADALDASRLEAAEERHRELLAGLVREDLRTLRSLGIGSATPALALVAVAEGLSVRQWPEAVDAPAIAREVGGLIGP